MPMISQSGLKCFTAAGLAALALAAAPQQARAEWPERTITAIVPFATGGGSDVMARLFSIMMSPKLGQTIVIENKPGAGGNLGIQIVGQSKPDGYTILFCSTAMTYNPAQYTKLSWNPADLTAAAQMGSSNQVVVVNAVKFPSGDFKDLIDWLKKNPGKANFASQDSGFNASLFKSVTGTSVEIINYASGGETAVSVVKGETDMASQNFSSSGPGLQSNKTRALAFTGAKRLANLPNVPTTAEVGYPAFNLNSYFGIWVRTGTPQPIIDKINAVVNQLQSDPELVTKMTALGFQPDPKPAAVFDKYIRDEVVRWQQVAKEYKIKPLDE